MLPHLRRLHALRAHTADAPDPLGCPPPVLVSAAAAAAASEPSKKKYNLLYIISDQHSPFVTGCYGDQVVSTPHLDSLADAGVCLDNCK
jgi:hypothetical protein